MSYTVDIRLIVADDTQYGYFTLAEARDAVADYLTLALKGDPQAVLPIAVIDGFLKTA